jgi:KDO2-lipid IV(A) lauroyltransferase
MAKPGPRTRQIYRIIAYPLEALCALLVFGFFRLLPVDRASSLGGWLGRTIGPRLRLTDRAKRNLQLVMPDLDSDAQAILIRQMWDNLGRVLGEMPHIERIATSRVEIAGADHIEAVRSDGVPCILFSGHLANWEILPLATKHAGVACAQTYRAPNNPFVDAMLRRIRRVQPDETVAKGPGGARDAIAVLKAGRRLGMLVDQKMNDGIAVPFFGRDAMTANALAKLSLRYKCPVIPTRMERLDGCHFRMTFFPALDFPETGDRNRDSTEMMITANALIEEWVRDKPAQWLWLHRRWPQS